MGKNIAHFCGGVKGHRGTATGSGTKTSGMDVSGNGWDIGVRACLRCDEKTGRDKIGIYLTTGCDKPSEATHSVLLWEGTREDANELLARGIAREIFTK